MEQDARAKELCRRLETLKTLRAPFEADLRDIVRLMRPMTLTPGTEYSPGETRSIDIFDSTAPEALADAAGGLHAYLTNPHDRWFSVTLNTEDREIANDHEVKDYLDQLEEALYGEISRDDSGWETALSEVYQDVLGPGTAVMTSDWSTDCECVRFRSYPLAQVYFAEDYDGIPDTVFRCAKMPWRNITAQWPGAAAAFAGGSKQPKEDQVYEVVHAVLPARDAPKGVGNPVQEAKPFASIYFLSDRKFVLDASGVQDLPFHIARWSVVSGECYGRSPAHTCLPDVRMLQRLQRGEIRGIEQRNEPPIVVPSEGYLTPINASPGGITYKEPGAPPIEIYPVGGNQIEVAYQKVEAIREGVRRCFHADLFRTPFKKERQTAIEVQQRRDESLRLMAPAAARFQREFLGPALMRALRLIRQHRPKSLPAIPPVLNNRKVRFAYKSAAARAQKGLLADTVSLFLQEITPIAQVKPEIFDAIDLDQAVAIISESRMVPAAVVRAKDEVAAVRERNAQAAQQQALLENPEGVSKAFLNIAQAQTATT